MLKGDVGPAERLARAQLPHGATRWQTVIPIIEKLKTKARKLGLWNLFLSKSHYPEHGVPLTNLEVKTLFLSTVRNSDICSMLLWLRSWDGLVTWARR